MQRIVWIVIIIGIIIVALVGAVLYELSSQKSSTPTPVAPAPTTLITPTQSPTQTISPTTKGSTTCTASDLSGTMSFQGAAGNIYGTFTLKNKSATSCTLTPDTYLTITYTKAQASNLEITHMGTPSTQPLTLAPNAAVNATVHYPNGPECSSGVHQVPVTYSYDISGDGSVSFTPQTGLPASTIPVCTSVSEPTKVDITNFSTAQTP